MLFRRRYTPIGASVISMRGMGDDGYGDASSDSDVSNIVVQQGTTARANVRVSNAQAVRQRKIQIALRNAQIKAANDRAAKLAEIQRSLDEQARRYQELEEAAARIQARQEASRAVQSQKRAAPQISVQEREEVTLPSRSYASDPVKDYLPDVDVDTWLNPSKGIDRTFGLPDFSSLFAPKQSGGYAAMIETPPPSPPAQIVSDSTWQKRQDAIQKALSEGMTYAAASPSGVEPSYVQPVAVAKPAPAPVAAYLDALAIPTPKSVPIKYRYQDGGGTITGYGTASAISPELIITARHVLYSNGKRNAFIELNGKEYPVTPIFEDQNLDIAICKVPPGLRLTPQKISNQDAQVGDIVTFDGNPSGIHRITSGPVLSTDFGGKSIAQAPFWHGNSGGPVYNQSGDIVGVATSGPMGYKYRDGSIGFEEKRGNETGRSIGDMTGQHGIFVPASVLKRIIQGVR